MEHQPGAPSFARHDPVVLPEASVTLRHERALIACIALSTMLAPLNSTMIAVALPAIMADLRVDVASAGWLITSYLVAMAAFQPVAGKLGDRWGRRWFVLGGLTLFGVASVGAALASSLPLLLLFRLLQAFGGAIVVPNGTALVRDSVGPARRGARFGMIGAATSFAAASGPPLGGFLVAVAGWRAIFSINAPVVLAAFALGLWSIANVSSSKRRAPFDLAGAVLLTVVLAGTSTLLRQGSARQIPLTAFAAICIAGAALLLVRREARHPDPVVGTRFFRARSFAAASGAVATSNLAMYTTLLALPIMLLGKPGWTSERIGLVLVGLSGASVVIAPLGGRLADRYGRRKPVVVGLALSTIGMFVLALSGAGAHPFVLLGGLALAGVGLGTSSAGMQTAAVEAVEPHETGAAAGIFSTSRYAGSIVGASLLPSLLTLSGGGFRAISLLAVASAALATVLGLGIRDRRRPTDGARADTGEFGASQREPAIS